MTYFVTSELRGQRRYVVRDGTIVEWGELHDAKKYDAARALAVCKILGGEPAGVTVEARP